MGRAIFSPFEFLEQEKDAGGSIMNTFDIAIYNDAATQTHWLHEILLRNPVLHWFNLHPGEHAFDGAKQVSTCFRNIVQVS